MSIRLVLSGAALLCAGSVVFAAEDPFGPLPELYPLAATLAEDPLPAVRRPHRTDVCDAPPPQHHSARWHSWRQACQDALDEMSS